MSGVEYGKIENNWIILHLWFVSFHYGTKHMENGIELNQIGWKKNKQQFYSIRMSLEHRMVNSSIKAQLNNWIQLLNTKQITMSFSFSWIHACVLCMLCQLHLTCACCPYILHCSTNNKLQTFYFWPFSVFSVCLSASYLLAWESFRIFFLRFHNWTEHSENNTYAFGTMYNNT